ncbi:hypothetical protein CCR75_004024 [Bremia lactucae]|uniref:Uncharacterized protein n=1 Tax=Bremia lactucae TaxID=4779 RepID=A0A976FN36_BRELC|nr:hypothetical protein CCR75_004024 [Bremia lactucae]
MPTSDRVRIDNVSPVVPGLSGSKNSKTTSARSAYHRTTSGKSYPRSESRPVVCDWIIVCARKAGVSTGSRWGESIIPGLSTSI